MTHDISTTQSSSASVFSEDACERVFLSAPDIGIIEETAVIRAMRSGWVAPAGPDLALFEAELADRVGVAYAVALSSGTAALHLGLLALGVGPGDLVLTSTMTFAATANAIVYTGAEPYFIDVDPQNGNLAPGLLETVLDELEGQRQRVGAIMPIDLLGKVANYSEIERIARQRGIPVLADAAESLGASRSGRAAGSHGSAAVFSFNGNKVMTTSGGGMLLSDDETVIAQARYLSAQARQPALHYEHTDVGFNYRLSNVLAALGRAQLSRLDDMMAKRRALREEYRRLFESIDGVSIFGGSNDAEDNCWLTAIVVDAAKTGWSASDLCEALANRNIESRPLWKPMHLQPVFAGARGHITGAAERLFNTGLALPSGSAMTPTQLKRVTDSIGEFLSTESKVRP